MNAVNKHVTSNEQGLLIYIKTISKFFIISTV